MNLLGVEVLVATESFDLLLGFDVIKLGELQKKESEVRFFRHSSTAITINKPDVTVEFNQHKKIWVASWKWSIANCVAK